MGSKPTGPWAGWAAYCGLAWQGTRMMIDAQSVIALRLAKIAQGGAAAEAEAALMVNEKLTALMQSHAIAGKAMLRSLQTGESRDSTRQILGLYQRRVAANRRRLGRS
jgi:hypothetical protein